MSDIQRKVEFSEGGAAPSRGRFPWFVMAAAAFLFFWMLGGRPLFAPDEGRYALIGREMLDSGDWVVPTLTGIPYLDKPPLLYWLEASGLAVFGRGDFGVRFFPACVALLGVWLTYLLGKEMLDHERGVMAAAIVACSALYAGLARILLTDMPLSVAVLGAYVGFFRAWKGKSGAMGMWIALALAFLAKGPVGPALFVFGAGPFWWFARPRPSLKVFRPVLGPIVWVALALPWTIRLAVKVPGYLEFFYWRENIQALGSKKVHHPHPWHYAVFAVVTGFLPWTLVLPEAIWRGVKRASASRRSAGPGVSAFGWVKATVSAGFTKVRETEPGMHLALWWAGTTMAVFTISVSKLTTYYLPMFPALAVLTAQGLGRGGEPRRITAWVLGVFAVAIPTVVLVAPHLIEHILKGDALTSARLA
ncbi:MAG: glycosyltransferase family 39 protein, partial [Planctomycetes bacterium]|nr:glycosyltransferase family 39 protein [Planctomycetota bacterium]